MYPGIRKATGGRCTGFRLRGGAVRAAAEMFKIFNAFTFKTEPGLKPA